jgi:2-phospho-L-lactate guanylyltransferase
MAEQRSRRVILGRTRACVLGIVSLNGPVPPPHAWTAIIPIRSFTEGKTRLRVASVDTASLVSAFAEDVMQACTSCPEIFQTIVVSPDPSVLATGRARGCIPLHEPSARGINEAVSAAREGVDGPVIAILGDTPCISSTTLTMVIDQARNYASSFVADASGVGSTMWCAQAGVAQRSHFGHHSRAEHRAHGAFELGAGNASAEWARARRDVDTDIDLWDATRLGLGPASSVLLVDYRGVEPSQEHVPQE